MSWPGDLSTDVTRVGNVADNVIGFNVCHNISPPPFFSTYFAYPCFLCSVSGHISTDVHLLIQLLGICTDQSNWAGAASASCIWKDLWLGYYFDFKRLADVLHWKPYFTRFVHFSLSFAFAFCGRWHVSHMCLVSVVPHMSCVVNVPCVSHVSCVTCVIVCHVWKTPKVSCHRNFFYLSLHLSAHWLCSASCRTKCRRWTNNERRRRGKAGTELENLSGLGKCHRFVNIVEQEMDEYKTQELS